jgi:hypothetical protein
LTASDECLVIGLKEEPRTSARLFSFMHYEIHWIKHQKCHALGDGIPAGDSGHDPRCEPFFTAPRIPCDCNDDDAYLIRPRASTRYVWIL